MNRKLHQALNYDVEAFRQSGAPGTANPLHGLCLLLTFASLHLINYTLSNLLLVTFTLMQIKGSRSH